jgi:hypothetical protein
MAEAVDHSISQHGGDMKKPYEKPAIIHTEVIETRAAVCAKGLDQCIPFGPITS